MIAFVTLFIQILGDVFIPYELIYNISIHNSTDELQGESCYYWRDHQSDFFYFIKDKTLYETLTPDKFLGTAMH